MAYTIEMLGPAVVNGRPTYISPSAINRHAACPASWYFRYVLGYKDPAGLAAQAGSEGHKRIELYLAGDPQALGPRELPGTEHIQFGGKVEQPIHLESNGVPIIGFIDYLEPHQVTDWKFKSDFRNLPDVADISNPHTDVGRQLLIYATATFLNDNDLKDITLRHVYFKLKGKGECRESKVLVTRSETLEKWEVIQKEYIEPIFKTAKCATINEVTGNTNHCYAYHKACPFINDCPNRNKGVDVMSLFGKLVDSVPAKTESEMPAVLPPDMPPAPVRTATQPSLKKAAKLPDVTPQAGAYFYRNCFPIGVVTSPLSSYVAEIEKEVLTALNVLQFRDMRLADHDALKFGKWKAVLGQAAIDNPPPSGHYVVGTEEKDLAVFEALSVLAPAGHIVLGGR